MKVWQICELVKIPEKAKTNIHSNIVQVRAGHLGSLNTLFLWSREQMELMVSERTQVLFTANYGHGKTLILKSKALQLAASLKQKNDTAKVFFVSFTAANAEVGMSSICFLVLQGLLCFLAYI